MSRPAKGSGLSVAVVLLVLAGCGGNADVLRVAVAANFADTARELAIDFQTATGVRVDVITGSTGKHYAQIRAGAPYDVLLAADTLRPYLLEDEGVAVRGSRWVYAHGRLALAGGDLSSLSDPNARVAMANPDLAPYGRAAQDVFGRLGGQARQVFGESVGQAFQFLASGNVDIGLVAVSQVRQAGLDAIVVPDSLYAPIVQAAVVLTDHPAAWQFRTYMVTGTVRERLVAAGYGVPDG